MKNTYRAWIDLGRAVILIAGAIALICITLVLLPQKAIDTMADRLESRGGDEYDKIALIYLADEFTDGAFRIRGVIRNIAADPAERIDAVVRLYNNGRALLETVVVRLDKDLIAPNDFAQLELTVPGNNKEFAGYAVEFKLREGGIIPYKDMRGQISNNSNP